VLSDIRGAFFLGLLLPVADGRNVFATNATSPLWSTMTIFGWRGLGH
jgi:hypothetical protein